MNEDVMNYGLNDDLLPEDSASNSGNENYMRRHETLKAQIMASYNENNHITTRNNEKNISLEGGGGGSGGGGKNRQRQGNLSHPIVSKEGPTRVDKVGNNVNINGGGGGGGGSNPAGKIDRPGNIMIGGQERQNEVELAEMLRDNVKEFLIIEEKLRKIAALGRDLRKQKKEITDCILDKMDALGVDNINLRQGRLVAARTQTKVPLSKANIISTLTRHFGDGEQVMNIARILIEERDKTEKMKLKRLKK